MFGFQDKVIVVIGMEQFGDTLSPAGFREALLYEPSEIGLPLPEVIVDIHHRYPTLLEASLQDGNPFSRCHSTLKKVARLREAERVDHVDDQEARGCLIRSIAL